MSKRPIVTIKPREGRKARAGPLDLLQRNRDGRGAKALAARQPGAMCKGDDGQDFGTGYFNSKSLIAVRLLARENGARIDAAFFTARLKRALALARDGL